MNNVGRDDGMKMGQIVARCWSDEDFKEKFKADPKSVLKEYEVEVPGDIDIEILENSESKQYFLLPSSPLEAEIGAGDVNQVYGANSWCR